MQIILILRLHVAMIGGSISGSENSGLEVRIIDLYKNARPIISMMIEFILILFPFKIRKYFSLFTPIRKFINRYINAKNNLIK